MSVPFKQILKSEEEIRDIVGFSSEVVKQKAIHHLDKHCRDFIAMSPLLFLSTSDEYGHCDVSPRGDASGSVLILNDHYLVIPERPGNRRIDSIRNLLTNPHVGLLFIIPGLKETLRVNGRAYVIKDDEILEQMTAHDKKPLLCIAVEVEECFIHCAKAFMRSGVWDSTTWQAEEHLPSVPTILAAHVNSNEFTAEVIAEGLQISYEKRLY
ncbi:pyridoxamine 5'-phosphate oxidase family protein [Paenibacillus sp. N3.4]|uniref:pyridoxamine 5'-phosphate oxidase family protein n=1 Tax=Paenibacillus sp. N3.4 TaxID=2603222 RepID=UPI0011C7E8C0|nr:pyridoxamine 5'-phosphate oxidase family protein [Paenibacillus sp. N3.4]TXK83706.1 pyridoxamine 5'-phosphate oxidase family protein [Paenibacillus sp. N3.4]